MLLTNTRLVAARIEFTFHRAMHIADINDSRIATPCHL